MSTNNSSMMDYTSTTTTTMEGGGGGDRSVTSSSSLYPPRGGKDDSAAVIKRQEQTLQTLLSGVEHQKVAIERKEEDIEHLQQQNAELERDLGGKISHLNSLHIDDQSQTLLEDIGSLKNQIAAYDEALVAKRKGQVELQEKVMEERRAKQLFIANAFAAVTAIEQKISEAVTRESKGQPLTNDPNQCLATLREIEDEREDIIRRLNAEYEQLSEESKMKDEELAYMREKARREIPILIAKKDDEILQIQGAWERERREMLREYDKLLAVNKEQRFHLHRGTYIKADKATHDGDNKFRERNKLAAENVKDLQRMVDECVQQNQFLENQQQLTQDSMNASRRQFENKKRIKEGQLVMERRKTEKLQNETTRLLAMKAERETSITKYDDSARDFEARGAAHVREDVVVRNSGKGILPMSV
eukprot:NODE_685_length_1419_cov_240.133577_g521_i0.p1 GENE.NODE_685_length_1419_cov_240.133577_g521_i0~~NODE_685_length_1419_cov_240.133577_g521_i0.p1  ORF type:complete len:418 (-),score=136.00 NODE_685_length_1419_cov_240.133577_g521_i0:108-1361(-)